MVLTNATITIYNRKYDKPTGFDIWNRTVIRGVHLYVNHKVALGDSGVKSADLYKIRIPEEVENAEWYLSPEEYVSCSDPSGYWTIQNEDHIVIGECVQDIVKPSDLKNMSQRHCKVTSWLDNRFGGLPHWKIEGE